MQVMINYGHKKLILQLPDDITFDEYNHLSAGEPVDKNAFMQVLISAEKKHFDIREADLFVVNDAYRPTPTGMVLDWLTETGKLNKNAKFLISTGCHRSPDSYQMKEIFGGLYDSLRKRIIVHDAHDVNNMVPVGEDPLRGEVLLNRNYAQADKVVVIGSVEPHYFAGFTGGRKSIFPGLCDYDTIVRNHKLATSPDAAPLKLAGNPVDEHLCSLMKLIPTGGIFSIQLVQGEKGEIAAVFCGDIYESFERAKERSSGLFGIEVEDKYDLLLAEVRPPLDGNLYQLQKSLENCQSVVRDGGKIILFSPCREGIGEDSFYRLSEKWDPDKERASNDNFGIHKLRRVYDIGCRIDVRLFSELPGGVPDKVFFNSMKELQPIFDNFIEKNMHVCLVHDAGHTVMINRSQ